MQGSENNDPWVVGERMIDGRPFIVRMREIPPFGIDTREYPFLISIRWRYEEEGSGLPPEELHQRMGMMEERLDRLERAGTGYMMVTTTGENEKEWFWYARDVKAFMSGVNEALKETPGLPLSFEGSEDPEWNAFGNFAVARGGSS